MSNSESEDDAPWAGQILQVQAQLLQKPEETLTRAETLFLRTCDAGRNAWHIAHADKTSTPLLGRLEDQQPVGGVGSEAVVEQGLFSDVDLVQRPLVFGELPNQTHHRRHIRLRGPSNPSLFLHVLQT